jgi:hypothetical protein
VEVGGEWKKSKNNGIVVVVVVPGISFKLFVLESSPRFDSLGVVINPPSPSKQQ